MSDGTIPLYENAKTVGLIIDASLRYTLYTNLITKCSVINKSHIVIGLMYLFRIFFRENVSLILAFIIHSLGENIKRIRIRNHILFTVF